MSELVKGSLFVKVASVSVALMLSSCASDQRYKREVNGNVDYLNAPGLKEIHAPNGMILPLQNGDYDITPVAAEGPLGTKLDIRPPAQALAQLRGSDAQVNGQTATLQIVNQPAVWTQLQQIVAEHKWPVNPAKNSDQTLTTDWVQWQRSDEDNQYSGRYQLGVQSVAGQQVVTIKLLKLQQNGKSVHDPLALRRYTVQMLDIVSNDLSQTNKNAVGTRHDTQAIAVQSSADESGLPNLIVRAPFITTWQRLPAALTKIGMKITDSDRSEGRIQLSYSEPEASTWKQLGIANPALDQGKYKLQVGDLTNRSSLQFFDPQDHSLTQAKNDALVAALQVTLK